MSEKHAFSSIVSIRIFFPSSKGKSVCVWYTDNGERLGTYDGHSGAIWDVDVSWDTTHLVSSAADNTMKIWHAYKSF
uniref:Uncharacterized protein n=1 Tax=Panagrolaimus sp. JU765 TaxID=591449 RepID=A0AC34Q9U0_9BILA